MNIDIYKSNFKHNKYLSVPTGTDLSNVSLQDADFAEVCPFKSEHEIIAGKSMIGLDSDDLIKQIDKKGYAIHVTSIVQKISILK